jgi:hypothetical protein
LRSDDFDQIYVIPAHLPPFKMDYTAGIANPTLIFSDQSEAPDVCPLAVAFCSVSEWTISLHVIIEGDEYLS